MTFNISSIDAATAGSGQPAGVHDASPRSLWRALRQCGHALADILGEVAELRRSLHRRHPTTEE